MVWDPGERASVQVWIRADKCDSRQLCVSYRDIVTPDRPPSIQSAAHNPNSHSIAIMLQSAVYLLGIRLPKRPARYLNQFRPKKARGDKPSAHVRERLRCAGLHLCQRSVPAHHLPRSVILGALCRWFLATGVHDPVHNRLHLGSWLLVSCNRNPWPCAK